MRDKLEAIMDMQAAFQATVPDGVRSFKEYHGRIGQSEMMEHIRTQTLACVAELMEAMDEAGWKPWATSDHLNVEAFRSELIDAFRFWLNLMHIAGLSAEGVMSYYQESLNKTRARVENGYDGVTDKCPACHRAYDDASVECYRANVPTHPLDASDVQPAWCSQVGNINASGEWIVWGGPIVGWVLKDPA